MQPYIIVQVIVRRTCTSEYGVPYLVPLLSEIVQTYMSTNVVVLLYDEYFYFSSSFQVNNTKVMIYFSIKWIFLFN